HGIGALCLWYLALEIGIQVNYLTMLGILPIISLVQLVPVSIAGWGVREGTVVTLFTVLGIEPSLGLLVSLIWGGAIAISALLSGAIWFFGK
ncbi:MAG: lysylphosphatidylglycerol synthase domain-containing protein, partial [Pseudomonadota bacterium]|nr:lysylphosphatidylglycerol synthase domain-containing protein [Pseudomonadota bacterium]